MIQTRQVPQIISVESEIARRKQLLKKPRHQFFLAMKTDENVTIFRLDLDPSEGKPLLSRYVNLEIRNSDKKLWLQHSGRIFFDNEKQIEDLIGNCHHHDIYGVIDLFRKLDPKNNPNANHLIEHLLQFWREQNRSSPYLFIHDVKCLADNIAYCESEKIWTLSGEYGSPQLLMSDDFSYTGVQQAIKDKQEREIFEKGYSEGRRSALKDFNLFLIKPVGKHERSKSEERGYKRQHI